MNTLWKIVWAHWTSLLGTKIHEIALPLLLYSKTQSASVLSLAFLAETLPWIFVSPFISARCKHFSPKRVLIFADIARSLICVVLALGDLGTSASLSLLFLLGCFNSVYGAFRSKIVKTSLNSEEEIKKYIGVVGTGTSIISILGPALGAILIASSIDATLLLLLDAFSFVLSFLCIVGVKERSRLDTQDYTGISEKRIGFAQVIKATQKIPSLYTLLKSECLRCLAEALIVPMYLVIITKKLSFSKDIFGWSNTALALGALIASIAFQYLNPKVVANHVSTAILIMTFSFWLFLVGDLNLAVLLFLFLTLGLTQGFRQLFAEYKFVASVPTADSAAYISTYNSMFSIFFVVGYLLGSILSQHLEYLIFASGVICLIAFCIDVSRPCKSKVEVLEHAL